MDRNAGLSDQWQGTAITRHNFAFGTSPVPAGTVATSAQVRCCLQASYTWESNVKLITLAAIAALSATPVMAQSIQDEQARADYHQAKADAERAQVQKEDAQAQAGSAASDAASAQAQANAAQADASNLQARANAAQTQADVAQNQANAERNAALDRAAQARASVEDSRYPQ